MSDQPHSRQSHTPRGTEFDRFVFFTDAVYAIAATLLIVSVDVPRVPSGTRDLRELTAALSDVLPQLYSFALGFWIITRFWRANHNFVARLAGIDRRYITLTLIYLGFVAFVPFPTAFLGDNGPNPMSVSLFALSIVIVATLEVAQLMHARNAGLLKEDISVEEYRWELLASTAPAALFLASIPLAFLSPVAAMFFWLLTIPVGILISRRRPPETRRRPVPTGGGAR